METIWQGIAQDFSDVPSLGELLRVLIRMTLAAGLGGILGMERARSGKSAGLRTHMLVALGAAYFTLVPQMAGMKNEDLARIIQGIITGIGFIGAGSILKQADEHQVRGLTTAAGLWVTAGIGMAAGLGREMTAILGTGLAFVVLSLFQGVEDKVAGETAARGHNP